jgi:signal transduction histidine kinase
MRCAHGHNSRRLKTRERPSEMWPVPTLVWVATALRTIEGPAAAALGLWTTTGPARQIQTIKAPIMIFNPAHQTAADRDHLRLTALGLMTVGIVHDVGNMIQVLSSAIRIFERHPSIGATPALRPVITDASAAIEGATDLIRQFWGFARGTEESIQDVDIAQCFAGLERLLRWIMHGQVSLEIHVDGSVPRVRCHRRNLENAILNLVLNARDATPAGGVIAVDAAVGTSAGPVPDIVIKVSDNGVGMAPEVMARAFDPFFTTKAAQRGSGLGLAMVRRFAQLAGGSVALQSTVGKGTEVTLQLPSFPR